MSYSADAESACTSKAPLSSGTTCGSSRGEVCGRYGRDVGEMWGRYWGRCGGDTGHDLRELAERRVERLDRRLKRRMQEPVHSWACEETPFTPDGSSGACTNQRRSARNGRLLRLASVEEKQRIVGRRTQVAMRTAPRAGMSTSQ